MAEHADDAMKTAAEAIRALRHIPKDETAIEARARACAAIAAQKELEAAARKTMTDAIAVKRKNGNGNGTAKPVVGEATSLSDELVNDLVRQIVLLVREENKPLKERLDALEKHKGLAPLAVRLAEIEAAALRDGGIWDEHSEYHKGCVVTHGGNLWVAKQDNSNSRPPNDAWRLMNRTKAHR